MGQNRGQNAIQPKYKVHEFPRALELMGLVVSDVRKRFFEASFSSPDAEIYAGLTFLTDINRYLKCQKRVNV